MNVSTDRNLSVREAAKILFATDSPTECEIRSLVDRLESGAIRGRRHAIGRGHWSTSADAVAEYAARHALGRSDRPRARGRSPEMREFQSLYQGIVKQYVLAVILRRRTERMSRRFRQAVLLGQIGLLSVLLALGLLAMRPLRPRHSPEQSAVEKWLDEHAPRSRVIRWHPAEHPSGRDAAIRVEYRYFTPGGKAVRTDRVFGIVQGRVSSVRSDW